MKKMMLVMALITGLASCATKDTGTPTSAIDGMFNAMKNGNLEETKKYISRTDVALLESGEQLANSIDPEAVKKMKEKMISQFREKAKNITYRLTNEKIDGNQATVDAEVTEGGKTGTHTFDLVKEEGAWKISLSKSRDMFNSMKGDLGGGRKDLRDGLEKLQNMPPDSLRRLMDTIKSKIK